MQNMPNTWFAGKIAYAVHHTYVSHIHMYHKSYKFMMYICTVLKFES